jgi:hypothetical protein
MINQMILLSWLVTRIDFLDVYRQIVKFYLVIIVMIQTKSNNLFAKRVCIYNYSLSQYLIFIKLILKDIIDENNINMKDSQTYATKFCSSSLKPICPQGFSGDDCKDGKYKNF